MDERDDAGREEGQRSRLTNKDHSECADSVDPCAIYACPSAIISKG
jgi:hypothetical protein